MYSKFPTYRNQRNLKHIWGNWASSNAEIATIAGSSRLKGKSSILIPDQGLLNLLKSFLECKLSLSEAHRPCFYNLLCRVPIVLTMQIVKAENET